MADFTIFLGFAPIHLAAQEGNSDMVTLLIQHGADADAGAKVRKWERKNLVTKGRLEFLCIYYKNFRAGFDHCIWLLKKIEFRLQMSWLAMEVLKSMHRRKLK